MFELASGQSLSQRFSLVRPLGRGGMGEVWLVRDHELGEEVVAKLIPAEASEEVVALLRRECRQARRLAHPHIVRVFEFHRGERCCFITMEHIDGGDIGRYYGKQATEILGAVLQVADALCHAHELGIVHRDLKMSNVLCDAFGRPYLSDFGIAGVLPPAADELSLSGGGSRSSMSPQQRAGKPPQPGDDIYGLGILLYQLLTGRSPHQADGSSTSPPLHSSHALSPRLIALMDSMTAKAVADRPADMEAVRQLLEEILRDSKSLAEPPATRRRAMRLTPPPRIVGARVATLSTAEPEGHEPEHVPAGRFRWASPAAVLLLATMAIAVFVYLPRWVEERQAHQMELSAAPESSRPTARPLLDDSRETPPSTVPDRENKASSDDTPEGGHGARSSLPASQSVTARKVPDATATAKEKAFAQAMSEGLAALDGQDYAAANAGFARAATLKPDSPQAADGLAQAEAGLTLQAVADHRERALAFETEERWQNAAREYAAVLALDATIRFAQEGLTRCVARAELSDQLDYHIRHPERLSSAEVLESADELLDEASAAIPIGPRLHQQIDQLRHLVTVASTPVRVTLLSDNSTDVVIYRVGPLGRFTSRELDLRPGTYTVVGRRSGYRDVRRKLEVAPGQQPEPLMVRCEEEI